ncbi:MAG: DNA photolyase family protein, partial [Alphaproteobacteria bacterium]|nr:DNA photolyase family protein [Alphaproteobacteria bacterium]
MDGDGPILLWLRKDLRLADNPALNAAIATGRPVIPLYILDATPGVRPMGAASLWWLDKSLAALARDIEGRGGRLILRSGPAASVLAGLIAETGAAGVVWNRLYDKACIDRDAAIKADLRGQGLACESFNAGLLNEPWTVKNGSGEGYKVFTPYWRAARAQIGEVFVTPPPAALPAPAVQPRSDRLADWALHPSKPDWSAGFSLWTPGEVGALARLDDFLAAKVQDYADQRDIPGVAVTSLLSPHLQFGEIGPRQIWVATRAAVAAGDVPSGPGEKFLAEVGWREFNASILFHRPDIITANFRADFDAFPWNQDDAAFQAWTRGETGYPIVDAGLRELWATGYMHNRVRMIVASFLIKHLL